MVTIDLQACTGCGICMRRFEGYCISNRDGKPWIDYSVCNQCQKCVAVCPSQAFLINSVKPEKITGPLHISPDNLEEMLAQRRSHKKYKKEKVPRDMLERIARSAAYAPNQNKNIDIVIVDDADVIQLIDREAFRFFHTIYLFLFGCKPLALFFGLFSKTLPVIKKKMEYDLVCCRHIVKENTSALYLAVGNAKVPVTEASAQYLLGTMTIFAQAFGIGTCLMDSLKLSINHSRRIKNKICIPKGCKVLGVLAAGYSAENLINVPKGYEVPVYWNRVVK